MWKTNWTGGASGCWKSHVKLLPTNNLLPYLVFMVFELPLVSVGTIYLSLNRALEEEGVVRCPLNIGVWVPFRTNTQHTHQTTMPCRNLWGTGWLAGSSERKASCVTASVPALCKRSLESLRCIAWDASAMKHPCSCRLVRHHLACPAPYVSSDLGRHTILVLLASLPLANHGARQKHRKRQ